MESSEKNAKQRLLRNQRARERGLVKKTLQKKKTDKVLFFNIFLFQKESDKNTVKIFHKSIIIVIEKLLFKFFYDSLIPI